MNKSSPQKKPLMRSTTNMSYNPINYRIHGICDNCNYLKSFFIKGKMNEPRPHLIGEILPKSKCNSCKVISAFEVRSVLRTN